MDVGQALVMFGKHKMVMQLPDYTEIYGDYSHLKPVVPQVHLSAPTDIFELKLRAESSERHFSPSFPFSSETATRPVNVDSILKTLDERIKDIEEEERKLEAGSNKKYHLVLATRPSDPLSLAGELTKLCPSITRTNARRLVSKENSTLVAGLNSKKARELAHKLNLATDALILVEED